MEAVFVHVKAKYIDTYPITAPPLLWRPRRQAGRPRASARKSPASSVGGTVQDKGSPAKRRRGVSKLTVLSRSRGVGTAVATRQGRHGVASRVARLACLLHLEPNPSYGRTYTERAGREADTCVCDGDGDGRWRWRSSRGTHLVQERRAPLGSMAQRNGPSLISPSVAVGMYALTVPPLASETKKQKAQRHGLLDESSTRLCDG